MVNASNLCDLSNMKRIAIDISDCRTIDEFYGVLLTALEAPNWHERNLDALWDSITSEINGVAPPYSIEISKCGHLPESVVELLPLIQALFNEARTEEKIVVDLNIL